MAVHIFAVSEENYKICVERGIVAIPEAKEGPRHDNIVDGLLSRLCGIKEDDYVLMYVIKSKTLRGVWQVEGRPFYDETPVWQDRTYPFRCRIRWSKYNFQNPLKLDDINDLRNTGKIWTWALERSTGSNAMFSISNGEFLTILTEFMKINPFTARKGRILQPYPYREFNLAERLHFQNGTPKYEFTIMALLNTEFAKGSYTDIFGNYSDCLCYGMLALPSWSIIGTPTPMRERKCPPSLVSGDSGPANTMRFMALTMQEPIRSILIRSL